MCDRFLSPSFVGGLKSSLLLESSSNNNNSCNDSSGNKESGVTIHYPQQPAPTPRKPSIVKYGSSGMGAPLTGKSLFICFDTCSLGYRGR